MIMQYMQYIITFVFIVLDYISGTIKAFATKKYSSTKSREGLYHKVAMLLCMVLGIVVDFAQGYMQLGFNVPVGSAICVYIVLMEVGSVIENVCAINPQLMPDKLMELFGANHHANTADAEKKEV